MNGKIKGDAMKESWCSRRVAQDIMEKEMRKERNYGKRMSVYVKKIQGRRNEIG
jgi:hypothetical protein